MVGLWSPTGHPPKTHQTRPTKDPPETHQTPIKNPPRPHQKPTNTKHLPKPHQTPTRNRTGRQTERRTDGRTDRQRDRHTDRQTNRDRQTDRHTNKQTDSLMMSDAQLLCSSVILLLARWRGCSSAVLWISALGPKAPSCVSAFRGSRSLQRSSVVFL